MLNSRNIGAVWKNNFVVRMSTHDDRFNRTWLWRVLRSKKILNQIRVRSEELFKVITASMDHYLEVGPPAELNKLWQSRRPRQPPQGGCLHVKNPLFFDPYHEINPWHSLILLSFVAAWGRIVFKERIYKIWKQFTTGSITMSIFRPFQLLGFFNSINKRKISIDKSCNY